MKAKTFLIPKLSYIFFWIFFWNFKDFGFSGKYIVPPLAVWWSVRWYICVHTRIKFAESLLPYIHTTANSSCSHRPHTHPPFSHKFYFSSSPLLFGSAHKALENFAGYSCGREDVGRNMFCAALLWEIMLTCLKGRRGGFPHIPDWISMRKHFFRFFLLNRQCRHFAAFAMLLYASLFFLYSASLHGFPKKAPTSSESFCVCVRGERVLTE